MLPLCYLTLADQCVTNIALDAFPEPVVWQVYQPALQLAVRRVLTDNVRASIRNSLNSGASASSTHSLPPTFASPGASGAGFELRARTVRSDASRS